LSHWDSNEKLKEKSVSYKRKTFYRFTTADSCTGNITHNTESAAVWDWSVSGGGHRWFKSSIRKKMPVTRDNNNNNNHSSFTAGLLFFIAYSVTDQTLFINYSSKHCRTLLHYYYYYYYYYFIMTVVQGLKLYA
jgi:hypothetical protein